MNPPQIKSLKVQCLYGFPCVSNQYFLTIPQCLLLPSALWCKNSKKQTINCIQNTQRGLQGLLAMFCGSSLTSQSEHTLIIMWQICGRDISWDNDGGVSSSTSLLLCKNILGLWHLNKWMGVRKGSSGFIRWQWTLNWESSTFVDCAETSSTIAECCRNDSLAGTWVFQKPCKHQWQRWQ